MGTAGNASVISDGAAAVVVMERVETAEAAGMHGFWRLSVPRPASGIDMKYVLVAPIWAIPKCLEKEGISVADVDLVRNQRGIFSGSTVAVCLNELRLDVEKVNVNGGSVAMGHPIGASADAGCWSHCCMR